MSGYTPGPWFADGCKVWGRRSGLPNRGNPGPEYAHKIADAAHHHPYKLDGQRANARLMAAAPELFEAASYLMAHDDDPDDSGLGQATYEEAWNMLEAAVEKAEGRAGS